MIEQKLRGLPRDARTDDARRLMRSDVEAARQDARARRAEYRAAWLELGFIAGLAALLWALYGYARHVLG